MSWLEIESRAGEPVHVGQTRLTPFIQTVRINLPGPSGVFSWSRPDSVLAQNSTEEEQIIPIIDVTRRAQLMILGLGLLSSLLIWMIYRRKGAQHD